MNKDLIFHLQIEIGEVQSEMAKLLLEKKELETELIMWSDKVRASGGKKLPQEEYKAICNKQTKLRRQLNANEATRLPLGKKIAELCTLLNAAKREATENHIDEAEVSYNEVFQKISEIRNKYLSFAEDQTRISSMRIMASSIARELTDVISIRGEK